MDSVYQLDLTDNICRPTCFSVNLILRKTTNPLQTLFEGFKRVCNVLLQLAFEILVSLVLFV